MTKYEFKQAKKAEKKAEKERKKFEKKSNSKLSWKDTWLYRTLVRVIPMGALIYFMLITIQTMTTSIQPEPKHFNFEVFNIKILDFYIVPIYLPIALFFLVIAFIIMLVFMFKFIANGKRDTKLAKNLGIASKVYSPTLIKILSTALFGWFYGIMWLAMKIAEMYGETVQSIVDISLWCFLVAGVSGVLGEFIYQKRLKKIEKNQHDATHQDRMATYDLNEKLENL